MSELHALNDQYYEPDNKKIFKKFNSFEKRINIWTDFLRINKTHFKARFAINSNNLSPIDGSQLESN